VSSTAITALHALVVFVVDKVIEEDRRMLLVNELEPMARPDNTTQSLGPATPDTFATF
jgi:hypothetical protein